MAGEAGVVVDPATTELPETAGGLGCRSSSAFLAGLLMIAAACTPSKPERAEQETAGAGGDTGLVGNVCAPPNPGTAGATDTLLSWCTLPVQPGPCDEEWPMYWFNADTGQCEPFTYGGCEGNHNRWDLVDCLESCACQQSTGRPDGCPCSSSSQCAAACVAQAPANDQSGDACVSAWSAVCQSEPSSGCYCLLGASTDGAPEVRCADGSAPSATASDCDAEFARDDGCLCTDDDQCAAGYCIAPLRDWPCCEGAQVGVCATKPFGCHCVLGFWDSAGNANEVYCTDPAP
jgi:hypothetical protein